MLDGVCTVKSCLAQPPHKTVQWWVSSSPQDSLLLAYARNCQFTFAWSQSQKNRKCRPIKMCRRHIHVRRRRIITQTTQGLILDRKAENNIPALLDKNNERLFRLITQPGMFKKGCELHQSFNCVAYPSQLHFLIHNCGAHQD